MARPTALAVLCVFTLMVSSFATADERAVPPACGGGGSPACLAAILDRAQDLALSAPPDGARDGALRTVAAAQARSGDIAGALASAEAIDSGQLRNSSVIHTAATQARTGDAAGALSTIGAIEEGPDLAFALFEVSAALAQAGDDEAAMQVAKELTEPIERASAISLIAQAQTGAGDFAAARATAAAIDVADARAQALVFIAQSEANAGDYAAAEAALEGLDDPFARDQVLATLASSLAFGGEADAALATVRRIGDASLRDRALHLLALARAQAEDFAAALALVGDIEGALQRASSLSRIAGLQAGAGDLDGALGTTRWIADLAARTDALRAVAGQVAGDRPSAARQILIEAEGVAGRIEDERLREALLTSLARAQAQAGFLKSLAKLVERAPEGVDRDSRLHFLVQGYLAEGDVAAARKAAGEIDYVEAKATALLDIAKAEAAGGPLADEAVVALEALARSQSDPWLADRVRGNLALTLGDSGSPAEGLAAAGAIAGEELRGRSEGYLARLLAAAGQLEDALVAIRGIADAPARVDALREIALGRGKEGDFTAVFAAMEAMPSDADRASVLAHVVLHLMERR